MPLLREEARSPHRRLHQLLCGIFSEQELRRWIRFDDELAVLGQELPQGNVSLAELVNVFIEVASRHGLLDEAFFRRLVSARPRKRAEIEAVEALFETSRSRATDRASDTGRWFSMRLKLGRLNIVIALGSGATIIGAVAIRAMHVRPDALAVAEGTDVATLYVSSYRIPFIDERSVDSIAPRRKPVAQPSQEKWPLSLPPPRDVVQRLAEEAVASCRRFGDLSAVSVVVTIDLTRGRVSSIMLSTAYGLQHECMSQALLGMKIPAVKGFGEQKYLLHFLQPDKPMDD